MIVRNKRIYKNTSLLKQNRLEKLLLEGNKCEICSKDTKLVHHIDGGRKNHQISNLKVLCRKHHILAHKSINTIPFFYYSPKRNILKHENYLSFLKKRYDFNLYGNLIPIINSYIKIENRKKK